MYNIKKNLLKNKLKVLFNKQLIFNYFIVKQNWLLLIFFFILIIRKQYEKI